MGGGRDANIKMLRNGRKTKRVAPKINHSVGHILDYLFSDLWEILTRLD